MRRAVAASMCGFVASLVTGAGHAVRPPSVTPGSRVRLAVPRLEPKKVVGTLEELEADSLRIVPSEKVATLGTNEIESLQLSQGRPRRSAWSALLGAVLGGATGAYAGHRGCDDSDNPGQDLCPFVGGLVGTGVGAALGALVGFWVRGENDGKPFRWGCSDWGWDGGRGTLAPAPL